MHRTALYDNLLQIRKIKETDLKNVYAINSTWSTNNGKCVIINNNTCSKLVIRFINTGYITTVRASDLLKGTIKDKLKPTVFNVGYLGLNHSFIKKKYGLFYKKAYTEWQDMIRRCYNTKSGSYKMYGAKGVRVCDRWKNFSYFFYDIQKLNGWNKDKFLNSDIFLDKDKLQSATPTSKKIYSEKTCCWLSREENNSISNYDHLKRKFIVIYPDNSTEIVIGVRKFAKNNNINFTNICACINGRQLSYKGMKFKEYKE